MKVLCVRLDNAGDVLLAGPAIRAVAAGADHVTLLCGPHGAQVARLLPGVDDVRSWRAPWIDPEPPSVRRTEIDGLVDKLAEAAFDRALIFGSFHQSPLPTALVLRLAGVPWIGATSVDYPGSLLDLRHRIDDDVHEVERGLALARAAGYELPAGDDGRLRLDVERHERTGHVVVHPGASVPARAWSPERHRALVRALAARSDEVLVTGGTDEASLTAHVAGEDGRDLGGTTTLTQLAQVIGSARAIVVGNTGPAHVAAAMGTPVVSLYAPTVPAVRWRPWGVPHELLHAEVPCAGCRARECPVPGHPCVETVLPGDAIAALDRIAVPA